MTAPNDHSPHLAHHFESMEQQSESAKLGMWVFLVTEILLFGGLFCWYAVYRAHHPEVFRYASEFLSKELGGINTIVLICSSLTVAWAVRCAQLGDNRMVVRLLAATIVFACCFLGIKFVEYKAKWEHGLLWGTRYHHPEHGEQAAPPPAKEEEKPGEPEKPRAGEEKSLIEPSAAGPAGLARGGEAEAAAPHVPKNVHLFFGVYFVMTGLHGLHVIAGMGVLLWLLLRARKGHFSPEYFMPVDLGGLYWHLVDIIWIFLFPLLYLIE